MKENKKRTSPDDPQNHLYSEASPCVTNPTLSSMPISLNNPNSKKTKNRNEKQKTMKKKKFFDKMKDKLFNFSKQEEKQVLNKLDISGPTDFRVFKQLTNHENKNTFFI